DTGGQPLTAVVQKFRCRVGDRCGRRMLDGLQAVDAGGGVMEWRFAQKLRQGHVADEMPNRLRHVVRHGSSCQPPTECTQPGPRETPDETVSGPAGPGRRGARTARASDIRAPETRALLVSS